MNIVGQLKKAIRDSGETPYAISQGSGVDQSVLSRFLADDEDRHRDIRLEVAAKLCSYLGVTLSAKKSRSRK